MRKQAHNLASCCISRKRRESSAAIALSRSQNIFFTNKQKTNSENSEPCCASRERSIAPTFDFIGLRVSDLGRFWHRRGTMVPGVLYLQTLQLRIMQILITIQLCSSPYLHRPLSLSLSLSRFLSPCHSNSYHSRSECWLYRSDNDIPRENQYEIGTEYGFWRCVLCSSARTFSQSLNLL